MTSWCGPPGSGLWCLETGACERGGTHSWLTKVLGCQSSRFGTFTTTLTIAYSSAALFQFKSHRTRRASSYIRIATVNSFSE